MLVVLGMNTFAGEGEKLQKYLSNIIKERQNYFLHDVLSASNYAHDTMVETSHVCPFLVFWISAEPIHNFFTQIMPLTAHLSV